MATRALVCLLWSAACTSTQPIAPAESEPEFAPAPKAPKISGVYAVDDQRALIGGHDGATWLALVDGEAAPVWTYTLPPAVTARSLPSAYRPHVAGGVVSLPWLEDAGYRGAVGLDLATGAERWRAVVSADELMALHVTGAELVHSVGDAAQRIDVIDDFRRIALLAFDQATGARRWATAIDAGVFHQRRNILAPAHFIFPAGDADPDDPDNHDSRWHIVRRGDGERVYTIDGGDAGCVVDQRFYVQRGSAIAVVDLRAPTLAARELLPRVDMPGLAGAGRLLSCHEYAGAPVLVTEHEHRASQFAGLDPAGGVAWRISLGERRISSSQYLYTGNDPLPTVLPPFVPRITEGKFGGAAIVIVDLAGRRLARELIQDIDRWWDAYLFFADGRFFVSLAPNEHPDAPIDGPRRFVRLVAAIDGATGTLGQAIEVSGEQALRPDNVAGGRLWLAVRAPGEAIRAAPRVRVDTATMRVVGRAPVGLELGPGTAELPRAFTNLGDGPPWPPRPAPVDTRVSGAAPGRVVPDLRRGPVIEAPWERRSIDDEAVRSCAAPAGARVELMAWEIQEDARGLHLEYALAGLDFDGDRGHAWCLTLLIRTDPNGAWGVYQGGSHSPDRRRILRQRPTNADVYKLLDSGHGWSFLGEHGFWVAAGDVLDDSWRAVTGAAPTRFFPRG